MERKKTKKKGIKPAKTRYIPAEIKKQVEERHFFQCAWDGEYLMEKHHIFHFSEGGEHTVENLILLCPNCHRMVHDGKITREEILERKSTHTNGDRLSGNFGSDATSLNFALGGCLFQNTPIVLKFKQQNIISFKKENNRILLNLRFYDKVGNLVFWMSENRFWSSSKFKITTSQNKLEIENTEYGVYFKMRYHHILYLEGRNYFNGQLCKFDKDSITIGTNVLQNAGVRDVECALQVE